LSQNLRKCDKNYVKIYHNGGIMNKSLRSHGMQVRQATVEPTTFNEQDASVEVVWTTGAQVRRFDWYNDSYYDEELVVSNDAIRMDRLNAGAPVLNSHKANSLEDQIGIVERAWIDNNQGMAKLKFSQRNEVAGIVSDVKSGVIKNISVGYNVRKFEVTKAKDRIDGGQVDLYRAVDWEPAEISFVPIPADAGAQVRTQPEGENLVECEFVYRKSKQEETKMDKESNGAAEGVEDVKVDHIQRAADISELCARHGLAKLAPALIREQKSIEQAREVVLNELARADAASGGHKNVMAIQTVQDETDVKRAGIEQAIVHRLNPSEKLDDNGKQYRGYSLMELGRDMLEDAGVKTRGMDKVRLAGEILHFRAPGMHGTSDFSSLFANVAEKRLRNAYDRSASTYTAWARRAPNAPDFKAMSVVNLSGAPDLKLVNEHGEFTLGAMSDGAETYQVATYGRIVSITRQAIINDDLRGFDRLITAFGFASRRKENELVYGQLTANGNLADGLALFEAGTHKNLGTGAGSSLQFSSLSAGRTAMRLQNGLQKESLNITPAYLIVPATLEQTAYQLTSSQYVPATQGNISEFRAGGRASLEVIVEPLLDAGSLTAWYLAAATGQVDTIEYCYLDGAEGPVVESEIGFETDGVSYKCRLDFATKAIDYRGLYKSNGV
jgi:hypothetical protein